MGIVEIVSTLNTVASGAGAVNSIKETAKSLHADISRAASNGVARLPITIDAPARVKVGEPVTISGTGVGMVTLYSDGEQIRELFPGKNGHWYAREYFGAAGKYIIKATDYYGSAEAEVQAD